MTVRIVLHVGPMKTGTSALAAALAAAARRGTLPPGVIYPVDALWFPRNGRLTKHPEVKNLAPLTVTAALAPRGPQGHPDEVRAMLEHVGASAHENAHAGDTTVILINETAARVADAAAVVHALQQLADEVLVVVAVREPRAAAASIIGQGIRMWDRGAEHSLSAHRVLSRPLRGAEHDYARIVRTWGTAAPDVRLALLPFLENDIGGGALMNRFGNAIGIGAIEAPPATARGERVHPSLGHHDLRELAAIKRTTVVLGWVPGLRERQRLRFEARLQQSAKRARGGTAPSFQLSTRDAGWVLERARPSIDAVREHLGAEVHDPAWREWFAQLERGPGLSSAPRSRS